MQEIQYIQVPNLVVVVTEFLMHLGYHRAEAFPIDRWRAKRWPEDKLFFDSVDACIKLLTTIEKMKE